MSGIIENMQTMNNDTQPWYRHRWPWLLMVGPAAVLIAGFITTWISFAGADALVVDDYYKKGKAINQDLRRDRAAATMRLSASMRYDAATDTLKGRLGGMKPATAVTLQLIHPTVPAKDVRRTFTPDASGEFSLPLPLLDRARWQVQLEDAGGEWRLHGDWSWPEQKNLDIQPAAETGKGA
jgi:hypothetical protein